MSAIVRPLLKVIQNPKAKEIEEHWERVIAMRCLVSGDPKATIHHCKGGSMRELLGCAGNPGKGRKVSDWLVIPLQWRYHYGDFGLDNGQGVYKTKEQWEAAFGRQVDMLVRVSRHVGYNVFSKAGFRVSLPGLAGLSDQTQLDMLR